MVVRRRARWAAAGLLALVTACTVESPQQPRPTEPSSPANSPSTSGLSVGPTSEVPADPTKRKYPDAETTGVPPGTVLTPWTDDCKITQSGTRIDARLVECDLRIRATDVVITRSRINGNVLVRQPKDGFSFTISDSEVAAGQRKLSAVGNGNFTLIRVEVTGGTRSIYCGSNCTIEESWIHGQAGDPNGEAHMGGIRMGRNTTLRFNRIACDGTRTPPGSGCSAALTGYGDFRPVENNLVEGNLIQSGTASFCAFGGSTRGKPFSDDANHIRFINNVFERGKGGICGIHGAIEAFDVAAPGNVWKDNLYDDGEPLPPRN